ncbi:MAG: class I SAM-dependent methyltransferase [Thermoguttaceae bacterium]|jgi:SAM-dependent methyltransferase
MRAIDAAGDLLPPDELVEGPTDGELLLADGTRQVLADLGRDELLALQWQQERAFARQILDAPKGSPQRTLATWQAYDTVTKILAACREEVPGPLDMGVAPRHARLVLELLRRQRRGGLEPRLFEIGYGAGTLLARVRDAGFPLAGIEVSAAMRDAALARLGPEHGGRLYVGDFMQADAPWTAGRWSLVYWNDVFEHVPPDEIGDWLRRIHGMLAPGGQLVTITPNWHVRPSDVTTAFCPPRTEAAGLHLKEYTLGEVSGLLAEAGFARVAVPLLVTRGRVLLGGRGLIRLKRALEPALEHLPLQVARQACRRFGLDCTLATKS